MIQENTHYANFEKIESYYLDLYKRVNQYNENKLYPSRKQEEYDAICVEIQKQISGNLHIRYSSVLCEYDTMIRYTLMEIELKEFELKRYTKMYSTLYKASYLVRKRFDDEFVPINEKQYDK